jgi:hypothetical protein
MKQKEIRAVCKQLGKSRAFYNPIPTEGVRKPDFFSKTDILPLTPCMLTTMPQWARSFFSLKRDFLRFREKKISLVYFTFEIKFKKKIKFDLFY